MCEPASPNTCQPYRRAASGGSSPSAGIAIIQVDEPALRELLPLRSKDKDAYLRWAVDALLATSVVADSTQIHTHLCYSEFGEVIGAIADLDADVTSIEAARSHMEVLGDLNAAGFAIASVLVSTTSTRRVCRVSTRDDLVAA